MKATPSTISITTEFILGNVCDLSLNSLISYGITESSNFKICLDDTTKLYHLYVTNKIDNINEQLNIISTVKHKHDRMLSVNDCREITSFTKNGKTTHISKATLYAAIKEGELGVFLNKKISAKAFFIWYEIHAKSSERYEQANKLYESCYCKNKKGA
jgi:hypothetical protein